MRAAAGPGAVRWQGRAAEGPRDWYVCVRLMNIIPVLPCSPRVLTSHRSGPLLHTQKLIAGGGGRLFICRLWELIKRRASSRRSPRLKVS